jgi:excisionase family DNA binding protein
MTPATIATLVLDAVRAMSRDERAELRALLADDEPTGAASTASSSAPLMTCAQAAAQIGAHTETIRRAVRNGELEAAGHVGRSPRIAPADLDAWLHGSERHKPASPPRAHRSGSSRRPLAEALRDVSTC